jgi:hypothetical protein
MVAIGKDNVLCAKNMATARRLARVIRKLPNQSIATTVS